MKKYLIISLFVGILSLGSLAEAMWRGIRNNTYIGVNVDLAGKRFTLPSGRLVWTTGPQAQIYSMVTGWTDINSPQYAYLNQEIEADRNKNENRYKYPVLYVNTTGYSIVWEDRDRFNNYLVFRP